MSLPIIGFVALLGIYSAVVALTVDSIVKERQSTSKKMVYLCGATTGVYCVCVLIYLAVTF